MSKVPTGTAVFSIRPRIFASRWASGTPRRMIPTNPRFATPLFFSTISCASRTRVRTISDADRICDFSRRLEGWMDAFVMPFASYEKRKPRSNPYPAHCNPAQAARRSSEFPSAAGHGSSQRAAGCRDYDEHHAQHDQHQHHEGCGALRTRHPVHEVLHHRLHLGIGVVSHLFFHLLLHGATEIAAGTKHNERQHGHYRINHEPEHACQRANLHSNPRSNKGSRHVLAIHRNREHARAQHPQATPHRDERNRGDNRSPNSGEQRTFPRQVPLNGASLGHEWRAALHPAWSGSHGIGRSNFLRYAGWKRRWRRQTVFRRDDSNLRGATVRTKRGALFNRGLAAIAGMFH